MISKSSFWFQHCEKGGSVHCFNDQVQTGVLRTDKHMVITLVTVSRNTKADQGNARAPFFHHKLNHHHSDLRQLSSHTKLLTSLR
jgi:hypothetical protein